jgi:hypothetical protein
MTSLKYLVLTIAKAPFGMTLLLFGTLFFGAVLFTAFMNWKNRAALTLAKVYFQSARFLALVGVLCLIVGCSFFSKLSDTETQIFSALFWTVFGLWWLLLSEAKHLRGEMEEIKVRLQKLAQNP